MVNPRAIAVLMCLIGLLPLVQSSAQAIPVGLRAADVGPWVHDATPGASEPRTPEITDRNRARGFFVGALVGAAAGALVGYTLCDHCDEPFPVIYTAGIGAVVGAVVGLIVESRRGSPGAPQPPLPDEHRGLYEIGYEANHFQPCDADRGYYPVEFVGGARPTAWPGGAKGAFNSTLYYVRWRGTLDPVQRVPLGTPPIERVFRIVEVLEIRAPRRGECGWSPRR